MKTRRPCELCEEAASLYCEADAAFLCWACDARVHGANFLVARHVRTLACASCSSLDPRRTISGAGSPPIQSLCASCDLNRRDRDRGRSPSPSSSSCISSAESAAASEKSKRENPSASAAADGRIRRRRRRRRDRESRTETVLASWSRSMGLRNGRRSVRLARRVMEAAMAGLPFRVCAAAAMWFAVRGVDGRDGRTCGERLLRRLEACSGVPAEMIVLAEMRLVRLARVDRAGSEEEGWAECS